MVLTTEACKGPRIVLGTWKTLNYLMNELIRGNYSFILALHLIISKKGKSYSSHLYLMDLVYDIKG